MAVSTEYLEFILSQLTLTRIGPITARRMFGGAGLYCHRDFFAVIDNDTLYFKVDDINRQDFTAVGMEPFRPYGDTGYAMQYYEVPLDILEDGELLRDWALNAIGVARRKPRRTPRR